MRKLKIRKYDYLVTGGAGFIGSHYCESLLRDGKIVLALDDLSTGSLANLEKCVENDNFSYVIGSVLDDSLVNETIDISEIVIHLAAAVGVENIIKQPVDTIEINVRGTENILKAASKKNCKVLIASTSEVYGKSPDIPFRENGDIVLGPTVRSRWSYACSKAIDEFLSLAYHKERNLKVTITRLFNTVGPRQTGRYGMVLPRFINQALSGNPITVYGDGRQTRCFSLVGEVIKCMQILLENPDSTGLVVNIGSTQEVTILELAKKVKEITGSSSEIIIVPYEQAYPKDFEDMRRRKPDISRLRNLTGFVPEADIDRIIQEVVEYRINPR